jgi:hypothetical protein
MLRSHIYLASNDVLKKQKQLILLLEIHAMLFQIEQVEKPHLVKRALKDNPEKPFVFAYHKN